MLSTQKLPRPKFEPVPLDVDYFNLPQCSNSDLTELYLLNQNDPEIDKEKAYEFGSLVDAVITEEGIVNVFKREVNGKPYPVVDFEVAKKMREAFFRDRELRGIFKHSEKQKIFIRNVPLFFNGISFVQPMRCKYDLWLNDLWWGPDLKSTAAETQQQFINACKFFDYDRQVSVYMTITGSNQHMLIGISKNNFHVFKFRVQRGDKFFKSGMSKFLPLVFKYNMVYG